MDRRESRGALWGDLKRPTAFERPDQPNTSSLKSTSRTKLIHILEPTQETLTGNYRQRLAKWERTVKDHERVTKKTIDDEYKLAVLRHKISQAEMRKHLVLNSSKFVK